MVDPTSDLSEDLDEGDASDCEACGATVLMESTHRVISWIDDDSVETVHFCDDACKETWDGDKN